MSSHDELEEVVNTQLFPFIIKTLSDSRFSNENPELLRHFLDTLGY